MNEELIRNVNLAREEGKSVGLVQGSWDMFHLGHLSYLKKARQLCDFLIVAMDDDEKIRFRKGNNRPIIPLEERYKFIQELEIADFIAVKTLNEKHWELIKLVRPDVLIAIKENYKDEDIEKLKEYCTRIAILPRQSTNSTSDIIRKTLISNGVRMPVRNDALLNESIKQFKERIEFSDDMPKPIPQLVNQLSKSTDCVTPVAAGCCVNDHWYFGINQMDSQCPKKDIDERTELCYATIEHAEINLLKQLEGVDFSNIPVWTTLFPCDKCMKVLIDKGVKKIYYLEDHLEKNWSKRSHALADKKGVQTVKVTSLNKEVNDEAVPSIDLANYKFIDPRNVRYQKQLEIMLEREACGEDPLDPNIIDQDILFTGNYWYVSQNRFPYDEIQYQFLIIALNGVYNVADVPQEMWDELRNIWNSLIQQFNIPGGALCYRFGDTLYSGASLKRLHAHLIVPKENNKTKFTIGGNKVMKKNLRTENNTGTQN